MTISSIYLEVNLINVAHVASIYCQVGYWVGKITQQKTTTDDRNMTALVYIINDCECVSLWFVSDTPFEITRPTKERG